MPEGGRRHRTSPWMLGEIPTLILTYIPMDNNKKSCVYIDMHLDQEETEVDVDRL